MPRVDPRTAHLFGGDQVSGGEFWRYPDPDDDYDIGDEWDRAHEAWLERQEDDA